MFDINRIASRSSVNKGHEDVEGDAEHGLPCSVEVGGGVAGVLEHLTALLDEGEDAGKEDDVFAIKLHG